VDGKRRDLNQNATRLGVKRRQSFRAERDAAFRFSRQEDFWLYEWMHEAVHGSDAAWLFSRRRPTEGQVSLYAGTADPELLSEFARFAATSIANASQATFTIFGWAPAPDFHGPVRAIEDLIEARSR
jgi:hypothetical protein